MINDAPNTTPNLVHARIREALLISGKSASAVSREAGLDSTYLRKMLERPESSLGIQKMEALAGPLGVSVSWLVGESDDGGPTQAPVAANLKIAQVAFPARADMVNDVPVMGTAAGSVFGSFSLEGGPIDYVRRPPALVGAAGIYAIYVEGDSMKPAHNNGDLRLIHPHRPPRIGDSVVVQLRNHHEERVEAVIGHLLRVGGEKVAIGKLYPEAKTVEYRREQIIAMHKVLTVNEMFGV